MDNFIVQKKNTKIFPLYVCMKIVYYTCIDVAFRYQGQGHLWVKRSSWKKIVPSVLYIHVTQYSVIDCHRNTILHFFK